MSTAPQPPARKRVPVDLTPEAMEAWHTLASHYRVSLTALMEAIGLRIHQLGTLTDAKASRAFPGMKPLIAQAQAIDDQRKRRTR